MHRRTLRFRNRPIVTIRSRSDWRQPRIDRVSQVVSLLSVAALVCTVVFAYLSWRESRQARQELATAFVAEKAPHLRLVSALAYLGHFSARLENIGESVALNVSATVSELPSVKLPTDARPTSVHPVTTIKRGQTVSVRVRPSTGLAAALGSRQGAFVPMDMADFSMGSLERLVILTADYEDAFGTKYLAEFQLVAPAE